MCLAAAHRRKESDLVTRTKRRVPRGELLIARGDDGRAILGKFRMACGVSGEKLLERGSVGEVEAFLGMSHDIFEAAKEEDLHAHGLGDGRHKEIVARAGEGDQPEAVIGD